MSDAIANILLQLQAKDDGADDKLKKFNESLDALGAKDVTAKAGVDTSGAAKLDDLILKLNDVARKNVTAKVNVIVDRNRLDAALKAVEDLNKPQTASILSGAQTSFLPTAFSGINPIPGLENTSKEIEDIDVKSRSFFDRFRRDASNSSSSTNLLGKGLNAVVNGLSDATLKGEQFVSALGQAAEASEKIGSGIAGVLDTLGGQSGLIGGPLSAIGKVFESLGSLGPLAIIPVIGLLGVLVTAVNAFIATLVALGASIAAAIAGIAALGAAFVAVLGPAVLLAIGVFKELVQIIQQVSATSSTSSTAAKALTSALLTQKSAHDQLAAAVKNVAVQTVAAEQAERDAVLAVADAYNQVQEAKLGIPEAKTALEAANLALKQFKENLASSGLSIGQLEKNPTDVSVSGLTGSQQGSSAANQDTTEAARIQFQQLQEAKAEALLHVTGAQNTLNDATNNYSKAQATSNNFTENGLKAFPGYVSALKAVQTAQLSVEKSALAVSSAEGKGVTSTNSLSAAGQKLVPIFQQAYKALSLFQPAIDAVLKGIGVGVKGLAPLFSSLAPSFKQLGTIMGAAIAQVSSVLESPAFVGTFKTLIAAAGQLIQIATPGFIALLKIFLDIAKDALPGLISLFRTLTGVFVTIASKPGEIAKFVNIAVTSFQAWLPLIGAVAKLLGEVIELAAPLGNGLIKDLTAWVEKQAVILGTPKGKADFLQWIKNGVANFKLIVREVASLLGKLGPLLEVLNGIGTIVLDLIGPFKSASTAGKIFQIVVIGIYETFKSVYDIFSQLIDVVKFSLGGWNDLLTLVEQIVSAIGQIKLPNLTGSVSLPGIGNVNPFHAASGGIATRATAGIFGEAGPEAIVPLTDRVFKALGAAIAPRITQVSGGVGSARTQHNQFNVMAPGGSHPDTNHMMAAIEQRLSAIGVA